MQKYLFYLIIIISFVSVSLVGCGKNNTSELKQNFKMTEAGGSFSSKDSNIMMTFPEGSVKTKSTFEIKTASNLPSNSGNIPGTAYTFGPEGTLFQKPVQLAIKYEQTKIPSDFQETSLYLAKLVDGSWQRIFGSKADTTTRMVTGTITGFSTYAVIGSDASVTIDPQPLSCYQGDEVRLTPKVNNAPAGFDLEYTWLTTGKYGTLFFYNESGVLTAYQDTGDSLLKDGSVSYKAENDSPIESIDTITLYICKIHWG